MNRGALYLTISFVALTVALFCQTAPAPAARFSFNGGRDFDEVSRRSVKLVNTKFVEDRFGNEKHAVFIQGSPGSYINLGNYSALKPVVGSISLWVKMESEIWSGTGYTVNPIILTKNYIRDDYYEAYAIVYAPETKKVECCTSKDSTLQATVTSAGKFKLYTWHHLVMCYNRDRLFFYIDGELENSITKSFDTRFSETDSVLVGVTGNQKNNRYSKISIDDIQFYDRMLTAGDVLTLYNSPDPSRYRKLAYPVLLALAGAACIFVIVLLTVRYHIRKTLKKEKEAMELEHLTLETELRVNRALMNPHFIFNSLNGLHDLILSKQNDIASDYLVKFARLIRKTLESNTGIITVEQEIDILNRYLEIESLRYDKEINYQVAYHADAYPSTIQIPIMMIQPFVENALWHGLIHKEGEKRLNVTFSGLSANYILCRIEDNGLGRDPQKNKPADKRSLATVFIMQRLELLNKIHKLECSLNIIDKPENAGTIVNILLPVIRS